jgi:hypothetical protein
MAPSLVVPSVLPRFSHRLRQRASITCSATNQACSSFPPNDIADNQVAGAVVALSARIA